MKITCLGSGTSDGVPIIGCKCRVCTSKNPHNKRLRTTYYLEDKGVSILLDASPDLREQSIRFNIEKIDAILISHAHYDHTSGLAEIKRFNELNNGPILVYSNEETYNLLIDKYSYFTYNVQQGGGLPQVVFNKIDSPFNICHLNIIPITISHGLLTILGYRIGNFAFITDASAIGNESLNLLKNLDVLILNAIRYKPHSTHFNIEQATIVAKQINAKQTYFTHMTHDIDHEIDGAKLPNAIKFAYDGMEINI